jgi:hypothetical protein
LLAEHVGQIDQVLKFVGIFGLHEFSFPEKILSPTHFMRCAP